MRLLRFVLLVGLAAAGLPGCSEKQKDAERMEQEMMAMDSVSESLISPMEASDSVLPNPELEPPPAPQVSDAPQVADASAIPAEEARPAVTPMPKAPTGFAYTIQVAACEDTLYARYLVRLYKDRGYAPFVTQVTVGGQTYYRVRVGGYATLAEARRVQAKLVDKYSLESWIDRLSK